MRVIFCFSFAFLLLFFGSCNYNNREMVSQPYNDSIKKYLDLASNDTIPFKTRDAYNQKAFSFIDLSKNDTLVRWYLFKIIFNNSSTFNKNGYAIVRNIYFNKAKRSKDNLNIARFYRVEGNFFRKLNLLDSSYSCYLKSEKYYIKTNDKLGLGISYLNKGQILIEINDYLEAQLWINKALKVLEKTKNYNRIILANIDLGIVEFELGNYDSSLKFYLNALKIINKTKLRTSELNKAYVYIYISNIYDKKLEFRKSAVYCKLASECKNIKRDNPDLYLTILSHLALNSLENNNYKGLPEKFFKILNQTSLDNSYNNLFNCNIDLSNFFLKIKDTSNSIKYANQALLIARKSKVPYKILNGLRQVGCVDKNKAQQCIKEYDKKIDSLLIEDRKKRSQFYKIQLETNEITQEKDMAVKQKWVISSIIAGILTIVLLLFVIFRQKAKQKELQLLQDQQKSNEEMYQLLINQHVKEEEARQNEKNRIAIELHDNVMNQLASTRFNLYSISQKTDKQTIEKALTYIDKIKDIENEIRDITHNLSNDIFTGTYSFKSILEELIDEQNKTYTATLYKLELDTNIDWEVISGKVKMNLYRMLQELVYNINKHAQATFSVISIVLESNNICMAVQDNGKGFVVSSSVNGIGLKNIEQRLKEVQGKMNIRSSLGNGTTVFVMIPI